MANGIIIIDKPAGWTSMDVCAKLRGILKTKKVGHAGTLDPMATGVLPVFVGQATRAVSFAEDGEKEYVAGLRLGRTTDTQDTSGETLDTHPVLTGREDLEHLLPRFTGPIEQVPPMYSAIKSGGQKLYLIARRGGEVERPARPVTIHELELLDQSGPADYTLRIRCSKGPSVRTLCHDIGQALGCGGCMSSLRRTMAAGFTLDDAVTLDRGQQEGAALLAPLAKQFVTVAAHTPRALPAETLAEHIRAYGSPAEAAGSIEAGVARAMELGGTGPVCALGTLYFSGDVRQAYAAQTKG